MASNPNELPESIVLGNFKGIRNTVSRERLAPDELESAVNIDIDDAGQVRRRRGFALQLAGNFHSVCTIGGRVLGVEDGELGVINPNFTFSGLGESVGPARLSYTHVDRTTYFSSLIASGKLVDNTVSPWGASTDDGEWISPVLTPTDTMGEVFGYQIVAPPMAQEIAYYSGRIYLAAGKYLWATELWLYDYTRRDRNFLQFEDEITLIAPVTDGLFIGTRGGVYFLQGTLSEGFQQRKLSGAAAIRGSKVDIAASDVHPAARSAPAFAEAMAVCFMTDSGICAGFPGGELVDLTSGRVGFPTAQSAAALYRDDQGVSSYIAVADAAGGTRANVRIGDYVDAEIIRAADRG